MRIALLCALFAGCGASRRTIPGADSDADTDVDSDVDSDADTDTDTDTGAIGEPVRPHEVCGFADGGGIVRALVYDCEPVVSCDVVLEDGILDVRPRMISGDCDAVIPYWIECEVPPGDYRDVRVWGERHPDYCLCNECDCGGVPNCIQLPPERLEESCELRGPPVTQYCLPEVAPPGIAIEVVASNPCACNEDRPSGCSIRRWDDQLVVDAFLGRCSDVCDASCADVQSVCILRDLEPGLYAVTSQFGMAARIEIREDAPWPVESTCWELDFEN